MSLFPNIDPSFIFKNSTPRKKQKCRMLFDPVLFSFSIYEQRKTGIILIPSC
jgi:hypothetical protein